MIELPLKYNSIDMNPTTYQETIKNRLHLAEKIRARLEKNKQWEITEWVDNTNKKLKECLSIVESKQDFKIHTDFQGAEGDPFISNYRTHIFIGNTMSVEKRNVRMYLD